MKVLISVFVVATFAAAVTGYMGEAPIPDYVGGLTIDGHCPIMESNCICDAGPEPFECKPKSDVLFLIDCSYCFRDQFPKMKRFTQTVVSKLLPLLEGGSRISVMQFGKNTQRMAPEYSFNQPLVERDIVDAIGSMEFCGKNSYLDEGLDYATEQFEVLENHNQTKSFAIVITNGNSHPHVTFQGVKNSAAKLHRFAKVIPVAVSNEENERDDNVFDVLTNPDSTATDFQPPNSRVSPFDETNELFIKKHDIKALLSTITEDHECPDRVIERNCQCESSTCCPDTPGPPGRKGDKGDQGEQGESGKDGLLGPPGTMGPKGVKGIDASKGDPGAIGNLGPEGNKGANGDKGDEGVTGPKGDEGKDGLPGTKGSKGETGLKGIKGVKGLPGDKGEKGLDGAVGDLGVKGEIGRKGQNVPGPKGDIGYDGLEGLPGDPGPDGSNGQKGKRGCQGCKGDRGVDGPQGDTGVPGSDGMEGDAGPIGVQGPDGSKGYPGEKGPSGPAGASGPNGLPGKDGKQGDPGVQGVRGDVGPQGPPSASEGPQGLKGYRGPQGDPGLPGPDGSIGLQGPRGVPGPRGPPGDDGVCPDFEETIRIHLKSIDKPDDVCHRGTTCCTGLTSTGSITATHEAITSSTIEPDEEGSADDYPPYEEYPDYRVSAGYITDDEEAPSFTYFLPNV